MAISYPLTLPSHTGVRSIELRAINAVAYSASPFTFAGQAHAYSGQMWLADITLPAMRIADAETWLGFLLSLRGQYGTFLLGNPTCTAPRGTAVSVRVTGSAGSGSVTVTMGGSLLAGDYIQLGSGSDATLHKVLQDQSGPGTLEIWPALRKNRTDVLATLRNARGLFRLSSNEQAWSVTEASTYGITFSAREAI